MLSVKKASSAVETIIGENTVCDGKVSCETNLRVEGKVVGDIECSGEVVIGEHAVVHSSILAKDVVIAGTVHGNVQATGRLTVMPTGQLIGNMEATTLQVMEGAVFTGSSAMAQRSSVSPLSGSGKGREGKESKEGRHQKQGTDHAAANAV
ncbi:bactofilin family protein [Paenibacillus hamazuiensis]|uniref:bactofilin family protein n=1 Tax=Paenibacillus hamazuiensis TaxID=2936508 RepID=UPI0020109217|nr:polymer-forming cytoskeletal protein [Paenibacillus hamazuiensis]